MAKKQTSHLPDLPKVNIRFPDFKQLKAMPPGDIAANYWAMLLMDANSY